MSRDSGQQMTDQGADRQKTFTKIVATVGPASRNEETLRRILEAGASVIRLNFSHGSWEEHAKTVRLVRGLCTEMDRRVAIFQDLQGPKIRIGRIPGGERRVERGEELVLVPEGELETGTSDGETGVWQGRVSIDYPRLPEEARPGHRILIDDGLIAAEVLAVRKGEVVCRVVDGGMLKPRKGVNLPRIALRGIASYTEKDAEDLAFAFEQGLDYVALSFVRSGRDVESLRDLMIKRFKCTLPIIAKIEKPEALDDLDGIMESADALMVARGDLGVETSPEDVPISQKEIIRRCNRRGMPVITATQMLESMIANPRPTRAEAGDVANAILDGTSAVMLSGETAAGSYPAEAVEMMHRIAAKTEASGAFAERVGQQRWDMRGEYRGDISPAEAVGVAARELAMAIGARYIVCLSHSGGTAQLISKARPNLMTVALSPSEETARRLSLYWGIIPLLMEELNSIDDLFYGAPERIRKKCLAEPGDYLVMTAGVPVGKPGEPNMIKVVRLSDKEA